MRQAHDKFWTLFSIFILLTSFVCASNVVDVYRMIQYDKGDTQLGCRKTSLKGATRTTISSPNTSNTTINLGKVSTFSRFVLLLRLSELEFANSPTILKDLTERHDVVGVVILLPMNVNDISEGTRRAFQKLESALLRQTITKAIYFAFEDEMMTKLYEQAKHVRSSRFYEDHYHLVVSEKEANIIQPINIINYQVSRLYTH